MQMEKDGTIFKKYIIPQDDFTLMWNSSSVTELV